MPDPVIISEHLLHKGGKWNLVNLTVRRPSGRTIEREVVRHPGAVTLIPILDDGRIVLIKNFRISIKSWLVECCAGTIDRNEPPIDCAARELIEETGYRAAKLTPLGTFYTSSGMSDELMHVFVAAGLTQVGQKLEEDESIEVFTATPDEALAMIADGRMVDGKSMLAILRAQQAGLFTAR